MLTSQAGACLMGRVYLMYYNNLVCAVQALRSFDNHFDTRIILAAAAAIHTPDPAIVNETEAIADADQPTQPTSTEDEDPNEEVVNDLNVIAEVKLPSIICKFNSFTITFPSC
jgi:hypothetical protein